VRDLLELEDKPYLTLAPLLPRPKAGLEAKTALFTGLDSCAAATPPRCRVGPFRVILRPRFRRAEVQITMRRAVRALLHRNDDVIVSRGTSGCTDRFPPADFEFFAGMASNITPCFLDCVVSRQSTPSYVIGHFRDTIQDSAPDSFRPA
jgi:hypothetical protein